jgi:citrate lyase beta subunit
MLIRSWLCASAFTAPLAEKAGAVGADLALFDLEDSVPADRKAAARQALQSHMALPVEVATAVRINVVSSSDGLKDLLFLLDHGIVPDALLLPKVGLPEEIALVWALLAERGAIATRIFAIIETVRSLWSLRTLSAAPPGLAGLIFGAADFAADLGVPPTVTDLHFVKQEIALAARRFGVAAIDSPCFELRDRGRLELEIQEARRLGFAGKIAIHPSQIAAINQAFLPSEQAVESARKLVDAADQASGRAILRVDDEMVGPPFVKYARQVLASAGPARRR